MDTVHAPDENPWDTKKNNETFPCIRRKLLGTLPCIHKINTFLRHFHAYTVQNILNFFFLSSACHSLDQLPSDDQEVLHPLADLLQVADERLDKLPDDSFFIYKNNV